MTRRWWIGGIAAGVLVLAVVAVLVTINVRERNREAAMRIDATSAEAKEIPAAPDDPRSVAWVADSILAPVEAGAGVVVADERGAVIGRDGTDGTERWHYRDPMRRPEALRATPDGTTVLAEFDGTTPEVAGTLVGFDALTGEVLYTKRIPVAEEDVGTALDDWGNVALSEGNVRLTNRAVVTVGTHHSQRGAFGVIDIRTGESLGTVGLPGCGGQDDSVPPRVSGDLLVAACWSEDDANRRRETWTIQSGVLSVIGFEPVSRETRWQLEEAFQAARIGDEQTPPTPWGSVDVSSDGAVGRVDWSVAGAGRFTRGGHGEFLDLVTGKVLTVDGAQFLASYGPYVMTDDVVVDARSGETFACPVKLTGGDCFGSERIARATVVGQRWVGRCEERSSGDYRLKYYLEADPTICSLGLDGGDDTVLIDLAEASEFGSGEPWREVTVTVAPGAVIAEVFDPADGTWRMVGLR